VTFKAASVGTVSSCEFLEGGVARPARWVPPPGSEVEAEPGDTPTEAARDGITWPLGKADDVAWIAADTSVDRTMNFAVPPVFKAYATLVIPDDRREQAQHDAAIMSVLRAHADDQRWWLGYLDTGADDVVFPAAPRVELYSHWPYVLVLAGPDQAAAWRGWELGSFWWGQLPNLMFPADRRWLVSTLWDDDWTCVGGTGALIDALLAHPTLRARGRQVEPGHDATPPGHTAT